MPDAVSTSPPAVHPPPTAPGTPVYVSAPAAAGVVGVARDLVGALTGTPVVLALLIVNCVFAGSAAWFLGQQEEYRHKERLALMELVSQCLPPPVAKPLPRFP